MKSLLCTLFAGLLLASSLHAIVNVTISGGSGSVVTLTIPEDIVFTNVTPGQQFYGFVLIGAASGNSNTDTPFASSDFDWNSSGTVGANQRIGTAAFGNISVHDLFLTWGSGGTQPISTSTMTLSAGTASSTATNSSTYIQGSGSYTIRFISSGGIISGDPGVTVPEPAQWAALAGLIAVCGIGWKRRRNA